MKTSAGTNVTTGVGLAQRLFSRVLNAVSAAVLQPAANAFSAQGRTAVPVKVKPAVPLMAAAMATLVFIAILAPRAANAMGAYIPGTVTGPYPGSKLAAMCANCHANWGGGDGLSFPW